MSDTAGLPGLDTPGVVATRHWTLLPNGRIRCQVCPRGCALKEGQRGLCFVRARVADRIVLTSYGRSSGFCVDPVEKKPLNHFLPGTPILSFGTAGCNLACRFCQNWDMSKSRHMDRLMDRADPATLALAAQRLGCRSIAYTYNDPVVFMEYAMDVARAARERGVRSVAVTAGYMESAARRDFYQEMDAANVDLKAFTERFYRKLCGGALQPVLETLIHLKRETRVWVELTTLLIPGENDSEAELEEMTCWVVEHLGPEVPMHFTAFHPDWKLRDHPPTPHATLIRARDIARKNGVHHAYVGNVRDARGGSTWCPRCQGLLIGRNGYTLTDWNLTAAAACRFCGLPCPGVFDGPPGNWGARRLPVRLGN
ncbi:MAG: AmmeMemoRadiSam system radical SAM enzyme [Magnetococcales bacterium]|nr:AmmeMemoRadiSam system radical SAM enzyme [Magnetococcales bacterium]